MGGIVATGASGAARFAWQNAGEHRPEPHARTPDMLTVAFLLFGVFAIMHSLDLVSAVSSGTEWRRSLLAMLLCLALATSAHLIARAL